MKLELTARKRKESRKGKRFYTSRDMAIIKHDAAVRNSKVNRGEISGYGNEVVTVCSCGREGCFVHTGFESYITSK